MNEEIKLILESQRMLLWENWRKWDRINRQNGGDGSCVETNEVVELVKRINNLIEPKINPTIAERTHNALSDDLISELDDGGKK